MMLGSVAIVGPGRMGLALGYALAHSGEVRSLTVYGRHPEPPPHPLFNEGEARYVFGFEPLDRDTTALLLAVPDEVVPELANMLAQQGRAPEGCSALHLSGALPTDVLEPLYHQGYSVGSLHPLLTVSHSVRGAEQIPGSYFAVTGAPETVAIARRLTSAMGAELMTVPAGRRPLYHAAVVMASSYMIPLLRHSALLMQRAGVSGEEAVRSLLPLVRGTLTAIEEGGIPDSIRGPLARGEVETVALHLRALDPEDRGFYALLGLELLRLDEGAIDPGIKEEMAGLFGRHMDIETKGTGY